MQRIAAAGVPALEVSVRAADVVRGIGDATQLAETDLQVLVEADLVHPDGRPTVRGRKLRDQLAGAPTMLLVACDESGTERARLHVGRKQLLYISSGRLPGHASLLVFPADAVPLVLALWGRLRPSDPDRTEEIGPFAFPALQERVLTGRGDPPPFADDVVEQMWAAPWRIWSAQCDERAVSLSYVDIEGHGVFAVRREDDQVRLVPRHSSLLWGDLQGVLAPLRGRRRSGW